MFVILFSSSLGLPQRRSHAELHRATDHRERLALTVDIPITLTLRLGLIYVENQRYVWQHGTRTTRDRLWLEERYQALARFLDRVGRPQEALAIRKESTAVQSERSR
jgi:hypothetical protein